MKYLVYFFLGLMIHNADAQLKATIDHGAGFANQEIQADTQAELDAALIKFLEHPSKRSKVTWNETQAGSIVSKVETDMEGVEKTVYAHTDAFTVSIEDISAQVLKQEQNAARRKEILNKLKTPADLSNAEINELLRLER